MQMKQKLTALAVAILMSSTAAFAQSEQPNVVRINPLGALVGLGSLSYERAISDKSSFVVSPTFGFFKSDGDKLSLFGAAAEFRYYFTGLAPEGTYVAPGIGGIFGTIKNDMDERADVRGLSAKLVIGHQWIWNGGFTLDLNGGISYLNLKAKEGSSSSFDNSNALSGILPALSVGLGYNF
jgi:opacity protein-like surface antigen